MSTSAILTLNNTISVMVLGEDSGMAISVVQGQTGPLWALTFKSADNSAFDLTGVTYTSAVLFDRQRVAAGTGIAVAGVFATVTAASGTATFAPNAADVAVPGEYIFEILLTKTALTHYFRTPVTILARYGA